MAESLKIMRWAGLCLLCLLNTCVAQWSWINPTPTGNDLHAIRFIDANTGLVVGDNGTIFRTTDGGAKWTTVRVDPDYNFTEIDILDPKNIWILGRGYDPGGYQSSA